MPYATNEKRRINEAKKRELRLQADGDVKLCTKCCTMHPVEAFRSRGGSMGHLLKSHCNACLLKEHRGWVKNNPERVNEYRARDPWTLAKRCVRRGIAVEELVDRYERQEGCCAICNIEITLMDSAIDHNHGTGEFRGMLCKLCNRALGMFKDSTTILRNAVEYLETFGSYGDGT